VYSASVTLEAILYKFSTTGLILNGNDLRTLAPDKLNTVSFIHDNYTYLLKSDSE